MKALVLYCKSYSTDLRRAIRLTESVKKFNSERIPFYMSVPNRDLALFRSNLSGLPVELVSDEDILRNTPRLDFHRLEKLTGNITQQIVKSEFWRLGISDAYLCLDSDSVFIRPFGIRDYMLVNGTPYFVITEAQSFMDQALSMKKINVINNFHREAALLQQIFQREGKAYSFGPMPMVWHRGVWESLEHYYLKPRGMNIIDAITQAPLESRWYGEALLKYNAIEIVPAEPFFKVYHYAWQFDADQRNGLFSAELSKLYSGVIYQSSWERNMDWPREVGSFWSRFARRIKRNMRRI
jgi:Family of unknown function (DUF6492)